MQHTHTYKRNMMNGDNNLAVQTQGDNMHAEKTFQGAWRISDIIDGQYVTKQYFGYTKKEAFAAFRNEFLNKGTI